MNRSRTLAVTLLAAAAACGVPEPLARSAPQAVPPEPTPALSPAAATPSLAQPPEAPPPPVACEPVLLAQRAHVTEGETLLVSGSCGSGIPLTAFSTALLGGPWSWDPATGTGTLSTGLADAGVQVVTLQVGGAGAAAPELATASFSVADAWSDPQNVAVDPVDYTLEWGLPVLHLLPAAALTEEYVPMRAVWQGVEYLGQLKIRGATSAGYPKKNLTAEFDPVQLQLDFMSDKDHLVLIGNFDDNSYVRQAQLFSSWAALATFEGETRITPRTFQVVVYLDGAYQGLYTAVDHVDDELVGEMGFSPTGNLYKSVSHDANFRVKDPLELGWEKKEGLPLDDFSDLNALTTWAGTVPDERFAAEVDGWLSRAEWMDWLLLVHFFSADDSGGKNAYLYDDPTGPPYFRYAPWDFNHSLGQDWTTARVPPDVYNDFAWSNEIFAHFLRDPGLTAELWGRFAARRAPGGPLSLDAQLALLDGTLAQVDGPAARDWERWGPTYRAWWSWRSDLTEREEEQAYLRGWLVERDRQMATFHP